MTTLIWKQPSRDDFLYLRRSAVRIGAGRGMLTIEVSVPASARPQRQLTIVFTRAVGVTWLQETWRSTVPDSPNTETELQKCLTRLRHPSALILAQQVRKFLTQEAQQISQALSDRGATAEPTWEQASSDDSLYLRRSTMGIEAGRGTLTIEVSVPASVWPQRLLTIVFTRAVGVTRLQKTWRSTVPDSPNAETELQKCLTQLGHRPARILAQHIRKFLTQETQQISEALRDTGAISNGERRRRKQLRIVDPNDVSQPFVPDGATNFGMQTKASRSGRGGVSNSRLARTPSKRVRRRTA